MDIEKSVKEMGLDSFIGDPTIKKIKSGAVTHKSNIMKIRKLGYSGGLYIDSWVHREDRDNMKYAKSAHLTERIGTELDSLLRIIKVAKSVEGF